MSKDKFFNTFKLLLLKVEICENKLDYIQVDDRRGFISATL